jgi:hypothetical protein
MSLWSTITGAVKKDEQWVVAEIAKAWKDIENLGQSLQMDVKGVESWITAHHLDIVNLLQGALTDLRAVGTILPVSAPVVAGATLAVDAATAAVDALSKSVLSGTTPISSIVNTYHAVKDAQTAVTSVLKTGTTAPASVPEVAHQTPVTS